ncbi:DEAD/DEAH box helicase [Metallibacterium scheffleri]
MPHDDPRPTTAEPTPVSFSTLGLPESLLRALQAVGYETPSPIQAATIPPLLAGKDLLGQAQTGTGKTAAFALPILARIDLSRAAPQALVLAPTRELAIQVAEAFARYAAQMPGFHVLPIYGGQGYAPQLQALKRGAHVIVGTPGRVIDHLERGTLKLDALAHLVLDEADEMLRMGFIDDVETILKKTPPQRQVALFSATMPQAIRRIAQTYLREPVEITIKGKTTTVAEVQQRYWLVSGLHKLDALTRILEVETFDGMIVFARTKQATEELAEKLSARGFSAAALNGDVPQALRERIVQRFKDAQIDILVATDVAARGLDVERVSHVLNYDIPTDTESYVHRIGRTGRAGRSGDAILFVTPRERHLLRAIERATRQPITPMQLPGAEAVNDRRIARFMERITEARTREGNDEFQRLLERYEQEQNVPAIEIAAALARMLQGDKPLLLSDAPSARAREFAPDAHIARNDRGERNQRTAHGGATRGPRASGGGAAGSLVTYRVEVGRRHGVKVGNLVGAIANEGGLDNSQIGAIALQGDHSFVDLPADLPATTLHALAKARVGGERLQLRRADDNEAAHSARPRKPFGARTDAAPRKSGFGSPRKPRA